MNQSFAATFSRMLRADGQSRSAKSVEVFGWIILVEGTIILFAPYFVVQILYLPELVEQAANYFRLVGLLVGGLGMLYIVSGRLSAQGFVFASMLDRPLVPPIVAILWYLDILPWQLALLFGLSDFSSFLWTYVRWRQEKT
jgi:Na+-driven multidrug efflux pump